jgi:hypothetical protein
VLASEIVVTGLTGNHTIYSMLGHHQRVVLVNGNNFALAQDWQIRGAWVNANAPT